MGIERYENILEILRCPATHAPLSRGTGDAELVSTGVPIARYRMTHGVPVLIDFARSIIPQSVTLASPISRSGRFALLKRILNGKSHVSARNCEAFLKKVKDAAATPTILVIGGATVGDGAERLYADESVRLIALDVYLSRNLTLIADAHDLPLKDETVDGVWIQAVLEHVVRPETVVEEIWRVLRKGGVVYSETPFMQMVHEGAYDFARYSQLGHRVLFRKFGEFDTGSVAGPMTVLRWSIRYAVAGLFRSRLAGTMAWCLMFWLRFFDRLIPSSFAGDGASCVYFLGSKSGQSLGLGDVARAYRGAQ